MKKLIFIEEKEASIVMKIIKNLNNKSKIKKFQKLLITNSMEAIQHLD